MDAKAKVMYRICLLLAALIGLALAFLSTERRAPDGPVAEENIE